MGLFRKRTAGKPSRKWWGRYRDHLGIVRRVPLASDKQAAAALLAELVRKAERQAAGIVEPTDEHLRRPLAEHLADFRRALEAKGNTPKHVCLTMARLEALAEGCGWKRLADLRADAAANWLRDEREAGLSIRTSNYYLAAAKTFGAWLVRQGRAVANPFAHAAKLNAATDVRRERRTLTADELGRLLSATLEGELFRGLDGTDRHALYLTALRTGARAQELASLTTASVNLTAGQESVTIEAGHSKRRRRDVLPLRADVAQVLRKLVGRRLAERQALALDGKARPVALWPGSWFQRAAVMLRADLAAARAAWLNEAATPSERAEREQTDTLADADEAGRVFDFHALRHQFVTDLARSGATVKEAQTLARHSTPNLTLGVYAHLGLCDVSGALDRLPSLAPSPEAQRARATGTEGQPARDGKTEKQPAPAGGVRDKAGNPRPGEPARGADRTAHESRPPSGEKSGALCGALLGAFGAKSGAPACTEGAAEDVHHPSTEMAFSAGETAKTSSKTPGKEKRRRWESNPRWRICNPLP